MLSFDAAIERVRISLPAQFFATTILTRQVQRQQIKYTLGSGLEDGFHVEVIKTQLTRKLGSVFDDIRDEIVNTFDYHIPVKDDGGE